MDEAGRSLKFDGRGLLPEHSLKLDARGLLPERSLKLDGRGTGSLRTRNWSTQISGWRHGGPKVESFCGLHTLSLREYVYNIYYRMLHTLLVLFLGCTQHQCQVEALRWNSRPKL